ncbi:MAG: beta-galactosidase trimerization domain-containing protein, partial [Deinococcota bacterium]|nr:beta-galactosidase trimerization domain-containing protein [Deinococcota bacterium]
WHWHSLHYGHEIYSHGILNHDLEPNRCYHELSRIGHELKRHDELLTDLQPESDVAFLYSQDSKYALEAQPCLLVPNRAEVEPDRRSYQRIFNAFYQGFFDVHARAAIIHPPQDFEAFRILIAPALYIADDALLERLLHYAEGGGHLLLSFRSGYADEYARARWQRAPGLLRAAVGASYNEYSNLVSPLGLNTGEDEFADALQMPPEARAEAWADGLELEGATPLAYYDHPHLGRFPEVTTQALGKGRITYVGTLPNPGLSKALAGWVLKQAGIRPLVQNLPESVRVTTALAKSGKRLWFFHNWSMSPRTIPALSAGGVELFSGAPLEVGDELSLAPWDVKVVVEG